MCNITDGQQYKATLREIQQLRLMDDILMVKCFEGSPKCTELLLRLIIKKPVLQVETVQAQWFGKSVGLDIFATNADGLSYNIKVFRDETSDFKDYFNFAEKIPLHLYSYFQDRPKHYIIHIAEHGSVRKVVSCGSLMFDGIYEDDWYGAIITMFYVNGERKNRSPLGQLMFDFSCSDPSDMNYTLLADRVRFLKESPEGIQATYELLDQKRKA